MHFRPFQTNQNNQKGEVRRISDYKYTTFLILWSSNNESCESSDTEDPDIDFEWLVNQAEEEENEDWGLPLNLRRMVEQEEREMKPHQEETEVVNLGTGEEKKEVKIGTCVSANVRDKLVALLWDYQDIFAWSY